MLARENAAALSTQLSSAADQRPMHISHTKEFVSYAAYELHEWLCGIVTPVSPRKFIAMSLSFIVPYFYTMNIEPAEADVWLI